MIVPQLPYWRERLAITAIQAGLIALAGLCAIMLYQARFSTRSQAVHEAESLAEVLRGEIEKNVEVADLTLREVDADLQVVEQHRLALPVRDAIFTSSALPIQIFGALLVLDEAGHAAFLSNGSLPSTIDFSSYEWFTTQKVDPNLGLTLTLLPGGVITGKPAVLLSRRINHVDGSFAGIAAEAINLSLFELLFGAAKLEPDDDLLLNTTNGHVVYRRNFGARFFGFDVNGSPLRNSLRASSTGSAQGASVLDGVDRLWVRRQLHSIGLTVVVGRSTRGIYAAWQQQALLIGLAIGCLLIIAFILGLALRRQLRRRERAELALRASEAEFRLLSDAANDMVSRVDARGQRTYVSPAVIRVIGMTAEAFLATPVLNLIDAEDRAAAQANQAKLMSGEPLHEANEFRVTRADGVQRWIEVAASTIIDWDTGSPDGYVASWRDVTDRKVAEQRLVASEERYRLLAESASDVITCLDLSLRRTYVSPASVAVLGYEPHELIDIPPGRSIHPDDAPLVAERFRCMAEGLFERDVLTNRIRHKAGYYIWVESKISLMRDAETAKPTGILCIVRDISDRKAAADQLLAANQDLEQLSRHLARARDAAERASEAKSRFLASVSHELRTPLNGIMGYAELLHLEGGLDQAQTARVDAMRSAGQHLLSLITGVLDLSEIETGRLDLHPTVVDLDVVLLDCMALVRPLAQRKGLALVNQAVLEAVPTARSRMMIMTDPTRLRQILVNLLGNAVKFTDFGSVAVRYDQVKSGSFSIEVLDTGPGIAADQRWRLFQEFERLDGSLSRDVEGAGLGLALSHRLATALGGTITYSDNPGGGSIFRLELPAIQAEQVPSITAIASQAAARSVPVPEVKAGSVLRVLIVDDVGINRDIAASFLAAAGHKPTCAECGEEGVAIASAQDFDAVLMDVRMPGIDGREATRRIRALDGPRAQVPIVALTAQAFADEVAECRRAGMDDHLAKPFSQPALLATLSRDIDAVAARQRLSMTEPLPKARVSPHYGSDLAVLDEVVFSQTAGYLTVENVSSHIQNLIQRTETLLKGLGRLEDVANGLNGEEQAAAAHSLAGSAGMFGFERLSAVARQFEYLMESGSADLPQMVDSLCAAATASLVEMRRKIEFPGHVRAPSQNSEDEVVEASTNNNVQAICI